MCLEHHLQQHYCTANAVSCICKRPPGTLDAQAPNKLSTLYLVCASNCASTKATCSRHAAVQLRETGGHMPWCGRAEGERGATLPIYSKLTMTCTTSLLARHWAHYSAHKPYHLVPACAPTYHIPTHPEYTHSSMLVIQAAPSSANDQTTRSYHRWVYPRWVYACGCCQGDDSGIEGQNTQCHPCQRAHANSNKLFTYANAPLLAICLKRQTRHVWTGERSLDNLDAN